MRKFIERRKEIEAIQYTGDNYEEVRQFVEERVGLVSAPSADLWWGESVVSPSDWIFVDDDEGYIASDEEFKKRYEEIKEPSFREAIRKMKRGEL